MMLNNLLFYRLVIFNTLSMCALFWGYKMDYIDMLMRHDAIGIIYAIASLLGIGIFGSLVRGWKVSHALNELKNRNIYDNVSARKMLHKNEYIHDMAGWAVLMGLFGNALGFVIALGGSSDTAILQGAGVAFGSTVAGILSAFLLEVNFSMIRTATGLLIEDSKEVS